MEEIIIKQTAGAIDANFDEAKAYLSSQLEQYKGIVFTEDSKKEAKATVADLRKKKKEFGDRVKEVKREFMIPLDEFLGKANELSAMFDEPIDFINDQVMRFEAERVAKKKELIKAIYAEIVTEEELADIVALSSIYDTKWENATTSEKAIREAITAIKEDAVKAITTIKSFNSDMEEKALNMYMDKRDLTACVMYLTDYEKQKAEILEREKAKAREEELERIRAEERERIANEQRVTEAVAEAVTEAENNIIEAMTPDLEGEAEYYSYNIKLTADGKKKLEMYMDSVGIEYEELEF